MNNKLVNPKVLFKSTTKPGPSHNGGAIMIGPDKNIYTIIGDVGGHRNQARIKNLVESQMQLAEF